MSTGAIRKTILSDLSWDQSNRCATCRSPAEREATSTLTVFGSRRGRRASRSRHYKNVDLEAKPDSDVGARRFNGTIQRTCRLIDRIVDRWRPIRRFCRDVPLLSPAEPLLRTTAESPSRLTKRFREVDGRAGKTSFVPCAPPESRSAAGSFRPREAEGAAASPRRGRSLRCPARTRRRSPGGSAELGSRVAASGRPPPTRHLLRRRGQHVDHRQGGE